MLESDYAILNILVQDANIIPYRPEFNQITSSVTASILLQQIIYRCGAHNKPFYKFKEPCEHELYQAGQSWVEELGFTRREFDSALAAIATKVKKEQDLSEVDSLVVYWTTIDRVTYFQLNWCALRKALKRLYEKAESAALIKAESADTCSANPPLVINNREVYRDNRDIKKTNKKSLVSLAKVEQIEEIFQFWQQTMNKHKAVLDDKRRRLIAARLADYSVDDLKNAILGCSKSRFHMGYNKDQTQYNQISNIFGEAENLEKFRDMHNRAPIAANGHDLSKQSYDNAQAFFDVLVNQANF